MTKTHLDVNSTMKVVTAQKEDFPSIGFSFAYLKVINEMQEKGKRVTFFQGDLDCTDMMQQAIKAYRVLVEMKDRQPPKKVNGLWVPHTDFYVTSPDLLNIIVLHEAFKYVTCWDWAIDAGAHIGLFSMYMATKFKTVTAFEPTTQNIECFEKNTWNLENVELHQSALGSEQSTASMEFDESRVGNSGTPYLRVNPKGDVFIVPLDNTTFNHTDRTLGLLKIDVEGYEYEVLLGGKYTIKTFKPVIIIECKESTATRYGHDVEDCPKLLNSWGYREVERHGADRIYTI